MNRTLSIPEWHQMALEGTAPQVRIQLHGFSMFPIIRGYRDFVTIEALKGKPEIGDIVLFNDEKTNRYVMHRVWEIKDNLVLTWGDNCTAPDGWMPVHSIWGKAVLIERGHRIIKPDPKKGMEWAKFWRHAGKVYRFGKRIRDGVMRRIRKLKVWSKSESLH